LEQTRLSVFAAPAVETEAGEDAAFVIVKIDHAVVAVIVHRSGTENDEENKGDKEEEQDRKDHEAAMRVAGRAAFFQAKPAMRARASRVGHLFLAFRAIDK
jgi:hypothetical protein